MKIVPRIIFAASLLAASCASAQIVITNVAAVNLTPSGFSVIAAISPASAASNATVAVFSDASGATSLAGQVGIEYYPLNSGDPSATNDYSRLLSKSALRHQSQRLGLFHARISDGSPNTAYYYKIIVSSNGQSIVWPATGSLPAVTTARENAFAVESGELFVALNTAHPAGSILTLSNTNTATVLAAVVGDGAPTNQAFFSVNDLLTATGNTNVDPLGSQTFVASLLGGAGTSFSQAYTFVFSTNFYVSQPAQISVGQSNAVSIVSLGRDVLQTGASGNIPISINAGTPLLSCSFYLNVPTNLFASISLQPTSPLVGSASIQPVSANSYLLNIQAASGFDLRGNSQVLQLNFTIKTNVNSQFVWLAPQSLQGANADLSAATLLAQPGRIVIVGPQPLLDTAFDGAIRSLVLYGIPGDSYQIQSSINLRSAANWRNLMRIPMTNISDTIANLDSSPQSVFYRAFQFTAAPPIVDAVPGGLMLYGTPGLAYEFDYSTAIGSPWLLFKRIGLTLSFQFVPLPPAASQSVFYRYGALNANPPVLQANADHSVLAFGLKGTNYGLQYSTNLSGTVAWHPLVNFTLTNSFQYLTNLGAANPIVFYRLKRQ